MMNYGEAGNRVNKRGDMSMAVDDEMAAETGERTVGSDGMDIQRMTFDPDKSRNFALQIPTSQIVENSFGKLPQYVDYSNNRNRSNAQKNYYMYGAYNLDLQ